MLLYISIDKAKNLCTQKSHIQKPCYGNGFLLQNLGMRLQSIGIVKYYKPKIYEGEYEVCNY